MRTIGLIGGMSWESSLEYYRLINEAIRERLGGLHSAQCLLYSVDFGEIEALQSRGEWAESARRLCGAARSLEAGGADLVVLCTNTMHKMADEIQSAVRIPFLHIADATGDRIAAQGLRKIGLLGTRFTMEEDFYRGRLAQRYGLEILIPAADERARVHQVIYEELCLGRLRPESRAAFVAIMDRLVAEGAEGIILGCTEIGLLVGPADSAVPLFDTARIHALAAVEWALRS